MKYMALWDLIMTVSSKTMTNNLGFGFYYYYYYYYYLLLLLYRANTQ